MSAHTPGPWTFQLQERRTVSLLREHWAIGQSDEPHLGVGLAFGETDANARLIAAAPELLEVVRMLLDVQQHGPFDINCMDENSPLIDAARATLAKAEGRR